MSNEEVLKAVFPLLEGKDLASCKAVCRQWRDIAGDDYFWKCLCSKRWPSVCKRPTPPTLTYHKLYRTFHRRQPPPTLPPPRLSFADLEFYVDIWTENRPIFSEVVAGPVLRGGINKLPPVCDSLKFHFEAPEYKMVLAVDPRLTVASDGPPVSVSVLVGRTDSNRIARVINRSVFDYIDRTAYRALAFDYLDFSPAYPFVSCIRAWISLLFVEDVCGGVLDVFGVEMDFCDAATTEDEVLWLLDMLDWK